MRTALPLLAKASKRAHRNAAPLLPPLALYRRILRAHKSLPPAQKELGDLYVRDEFKAHKSTDNPLYIVGFLTSWQEYLNMISNGSWAEGSMTNEQLAKMSPDQINQLYELMKETERVKKGDVDEGDE